MTKNISDIWALLPAYLCIVQYLILLDEMERDSDIGKNDINQVWL